MSKFSFAVLLVPAMALCCGGCAGPESRRSAEKETIEKSLTEDWGYAEVPIGTASFSDKEMTVVRAAESAGLLSVRATPGGMQGKTNVELTATPKLRLLATGDAAPGSQEGMKVLVVRISDCWRLYAALFWIDVSQPTQCNPPWKLMGLIQFSPVPSKMPL